MRASPAPPPAEVRAMHAAAIALERGRDEAVPPRVASGTTDLRVRKGEVRRSYRTASCRECAHDGAAQPRVQVTWFQDDLAHLFDLLASRAIAPRIAERIAFEDVADAHRRLEAGGLDGRLVLCPDVSPRRGQVLLREPQPAPVRAAPAT
jgi:hypothetical protein